MDFSGLSIKGEVERRRQGVLVEAQARAESPRKSAADVGSDMTSITASNRDVAAEEGWGSPCMTSRAICRSLAAAERIGI
jgi:hypothetical protein